MSILSAFNNQLLNLCNNLQEMYPDDPDISFSNGAIQTLKKTNPRKIHELFKDHILNYESYILAEDNDFFINYDFVKNNESSIGNNTSYAESIMTNLKKYWKNMDDESKSNIWKYLKVLVVLNKQIA